MNEDFSGFTRAEIAQLFASRGIECSNKAIDEAPIIHTAWNHPLVRDDPMFPKYRAVEDAVLGWNFEHDEWPTYPSLVYRVAKENRISRATAARWVRQAIDAGPWRCFITFTPAEVSGDDAMPTIKALRTGNQLTFRCPYCRRKHFHGVTGVPGQDTHRLSHCLQDNRFPNGYDLKEAQALDEWRVTLVREVWHYVAARFYLAMAKLIKEAA